MKIKPDVNVIRILVPNSLSPPNKDAFTTFINNVIPCFHKSYNIKVLWLIHKPSQIQSDGDTIFDIHDFHDAKNLLEIIKPTCIITSQTYEPINYSISLAAKFFKIPLISIYSYDHQFTKRSLDNKHYLNYFLSILRRFFSKENFANPNVEKKFMRHGKFMIYKYHFLIKTKISLKLSKFEMIKNMIKDIFMFSTNTYPEYNELADLNLLSNESWYEPLIKIGIPEEKLSITGNPFWDNKFIKIKKRIPLNYTNNEKIRLLVLTDSMFEHGLWTSEYRDLFLTKLFTELKNDTNISFDLKIHPALENKSYYESLLSKLKLHATIFQFEDMWDVIDDFHLVLSYGQTYAHTELSAGLVKLILLDPKNEFVRNPLLAEGTQCGHVIICHNFDDLIKSIHELLSRKIYLTEEFVNSRQRLFFQFDGKSGERVANEILKLLKHNS